MADQNPHHKKGESQKGAKNVPLVQGAVTNPQEVQANVEKGVHKDGDDIPRKGPFKGIHRAERYGLYIAAGVLLLNLLTLWHIKADSRLQHRAWVGLTDAKANRIEKGKKIELQLAFTNTGDTPANRVKISSEIRLDKRGYDIEVHARNNKAKGMTDIVGERTIAPNATVIATHPSDSPVTDTQIALIEMHGMVVYAFGEVGYDDIFGERHRTLYCCTIDPNTGQMKAYKQYNRME